MRQRPCYFILILMVSLFCLPVTAAEEKPSVFYHEMSEPFTINFARQSNDEARYLQIRVAIKTADQSVYRGIKSHQPLIEDELRSLFADQDMTTVSTLEGRKSLQQASESVVKSILQEQIDNDNIDAVYFTGFIWQ